MDAADAITHLARSEALRVRPVRPEELAEDPLALPYLTLSKASGRLTATGHRCAGHDNEGRMPFLLEWLNARVLPLVDPGALGSGRPAHLRVELHDSYSYLPRAAEYTNCLTFARPTDAHGANALCALLPDPYQAGGFGGLLDLRDEVPWEAKRPVVHFVGVTTGDRDPSRNVRLGACSWALGQEHLELRINRVVQMEGREAQLLAAHPRIREFMGPTVAPADHHAYRYLANLPGNTAAWSRLPMILASRSVAFHLRHPDALWYYPLLRDGEHYLGADTLPDLLRLRARCEAEGPGTCARIADAANRFVESFLRPRHADAYAAQLLEGALGGIRGP